MHGQMLRPYLHNVAHITTVGAKHRMKAIPLFHCQCHPQPLHKSLAGPPTAHATRAPSAHRAPAPGVCQAIADCLASVPSLLPLLHQLEEHCPSSSEVGPLAAAILEDTAACGAPSACAAIAGLRAAARAHKQALAAKRRQSVLASMSLRQVRWPSPLLSLSRTLDRNPSPTTS